MKLVEVQAKIATIIASMEVHVTCQPGNGPSTDTAVWRYSGGQASWVWADLWWHLCDHLALLGHYGRNPQISFPFLFQLAQCSDVLLCNFRRLFCIER
ncbi:hypothetical protein HPP92_028810, partial [Vanilla planifolia]